MEPLKYKAFLSFLVAVSLVSPMITNRRIKVVMTESE